jgi:hypothetical protein
VTRKSTPGDIQPERGGRRFLKMLTGSRRQRRVGGAAREHRSRRPAARGQIAASGYQSSTRLDWRTGTRPIAATPSCAGHPRVRSLTVVSRVGSAHRQPRAQTVADRFDNSSRER